VARPAKRSRIKRAEEENAGLTAFIDQVFLMSKFLHGAYLASNEFAKKMVKQHQGIDIQLNTPKEWLENRDMFLSLVTYRHLLP
jgi:hypothetical protein